MPLQVIWGVLPYWGISILVKHAYGQAWRHLANKQYPALHLLAGVAASAEPYAHFSVVGKNRSNRIPSVHAHFKAAGKCMRPSGSLWLVVLVGTVCLGGS